MSKPRFTGWYGGKCPVDPETIVEVVFRGEKRVAKCAARCIWWMHSPVPQKGEVILWRVAAE